MSRGFLTQQTCSAILLQHTHTHTHVYYTHTHTHTHTHAQTHTHTHTHTRLVSLSPRHVCVVHALLLCERVVNALTHHYINTRKQVVKFHPQAWHCMHPAFIREQLAAARRRLRGPPDIVLLHNPEFFFTGILAGRAGTVGPTKPSEVYKKRCEKSGFEIRPPK